MSTSNSPSANGNALTYPGAGLGWKININEVPREERGLVLGILDDLSAAGTRIENAAKRWVQLSDSTQALIVEMLPSHVRPFLERLTRVGEGTLHPQLYAAAGRSATALGRLPLELQAKYLADKIPVAVVKDGRPDVRRMDIADMDLAVYRQVFAATGRGQFRVRTVAEQRAWAKEAAQRQAALELTAGAEKVNRAGRWKVQGVRVFVDEVKIKTGLTRADVVQMLADLGG